MDRGYNRGEIQGQFDRARGLDRNTLLDRNQKHRDDTKIPLVLTYHPAFHRVYGILQTCLNALFVDTEHQQLFKDKKFLFHSEGPKISRILWFGPKFTNQQMNKLKRALSNAMAGKAVKFVHSL